MSIAAISVVSSAVVAVLTIGSQVFNSASQRRHDARQSHQARTWEVKRDGLMDLLGTCLRIHDLVGSGALGGAFATDVPRLRRELRPVVYAYGSDKLRKRVNELLEVADTWDAAIDSVAWIASCQNADLKEEATSDEDFAMALHYRDQQSKYLDDVNDSVRHLDANEFKEALMAVVDHARDDLKPH